MVRRRPLAAVAAAVVGLTVSLSAQQGTIRGTVIDKDFDAPLPGAIVQVVETGQRVETNDLGTFSLPALDAGRYTLLAAKDGYVRRVRSDVAVSAGQLTDVRIELLGDFTDLEEFVVQETLQVGTGTETALLDLRFDSPALVDSISSDLMSKANAGDAASALRLVAGASTQDGKSAVIRGLPDRYVSSQLNGVLLPSSDEDKRAVELDQFPSSVIESLQVTKTFTPDQQGNASGGAVNVVLRSVPEKPLFMNWKVGTSYNSQTTGRSDFLSYDGGGVHAFGKSGSERSIQEEGDNWAGAVGAREEEAPDNFSWSGSIGGKVDIFDGWRLGGFANFFYNRDSSYYRNGRDESRVVGTVGNLMSPQIIQGTTTQAPFITSLLSIDNAAQEVQFGGLATGGIASDNHSINLTYLFTRAAEDRVIVAEDTQGKFFFFPGHDPEDPTSPGFSQSDSAPFTRQTTIAYVERATNTLQLAGRHRFELWGFGPIRGVEFDWTVARNSALRNTPDRREFGTFWEPNGVYQQFKPAQEFTLGNVQRTFIKIEEDSDELAANLKIPFEIWGGQQGSFKVGYFRDEVTRQFSQETFSNFSDPNDQFVGEFTGIRWSQAWVFQDHAITAAETDADYRGSQLISATYLMLDLPITEDFRAVGGVRFESTELELTSDPEEEANYVPSRDPMGNPNFGIVAFPIGPGEPGFDPELFASANPSRSQDDVLPSIALIYDVLDDVTLRGSYAETLGRQTFKEISPVFQQEFLGGPIFIGDPDLQISQVRNFDLRLDYTPAEGSLFSVSYFRKIIDDPIEYVEASQGFNYTRPINYPRGKLTGWEVEARQDLGTLLSPLAGLSVGANSTWIDATVRRPDSEVLQFEQFQQVRPSTTRDMTDAPDYLWNSFATYEVEQTGSSFGVFYTVTGDTLIQGPGPSNNAFVPATYDRRFDNLTATLTQSLGRGVRLSFAAQNLTDAKRRQVYRTEFLPEDVTRREFRTGISYSLSISGEILF